MTALDHIGEFLNRITPALELELAKGDASRGLIVVEDQDGIAMADAMSPLADHDLVRRHV